MGKRVLLFIPTLEMGGAERQALNFAIFLKEKGIFVTIAGIGQACHGETCVIERACKENGIPCIDLNENKISKTKLRLYKIPMYLKTGAAGDVFFRKNVFNLIKLVKKNKYDIIVTYCAPPGTIGGIAKYMYRRMPKYVWYQRDAGIQNLNDRLQRKAITKADLILANAYSGKAWLKKEYGLEAEVIFNGVERKQSKYSREQWLKKMDIDSSYKIVTMVANLSSAKDHMTLLKAWDCVIGKCHAEKLVLALAGRFDDKYCELLDFVEKNGLSNNVKFLGSVTDVFGLYEVSTLCAFSTYSEGNPNALIEASLAGLAVVATDLPEIREVLCEKNAEYLFAPENVEDCSRNIMKLLTDDACRTELGERNKEKAEKMFGLEERFQELQNYLGIRE